MKVVLPLFESNESRLAKRGVARESNESRLKVKWVSFRQKASSFEGYRL